MFYLIRPDHQLERLDIPGELLTIAAAEGWDLGSLNWMQTDRPFEPIALRLALRFGIACSRGIALAAIHLIESPSDLTRPVGEDLVQHWQALGGRLPEPL